MEIHSNSPKLYYGFKVTKLNNKQIYHSWEALVESMGSEVPSTVLFSEGRSPEENSTVEGTEGP